VLLVFGRNITLQYDTGIMYTRILRPRIIQSYALNFTPPILRPQFYGPPKYDPKPGQ